MKKTLAVMCCLLFLMVCIPVFAADGGTLEDGDFGFTFYASMPVVFDESPYNKTMYTKYLGIGAAYHITTYLSVEPGLFVSQTKIEKDDRVSANSGSDGDILYSGALLGVYYYGDVGDGLYYYAGPRFEFTRYEIDESDDSGTDEKTTQNDQLLSLVFGLKYMVNDHLAVFGDMGLSWYVSVKDYVEKDSTGTKINEYEERTESFTLSRGMLGVAFYF
ncbi:MAG: outer membrane beta-barrel protein [Spirochaetota bacterium]